jgi:DNA-damage-inducible protein J
VVKNALFDLTLTFPIFYFPHFIFSAVTLIYFGLRNEVIDNTKHILFIISVMKTLQVRIPEQLRADADSILADIGLDLPTAVRLYLNKIVQTRGIPFTLEASPIRSEVIPVDAETQAQMDAIGTAWKQQRV